MAITVSGPLAELRELFAVSDPAVIDRLNDIVLTLAVIGGNQGTIMASVQDLIDAATAEKAQVSAKLADLTAQVQALRDQIAAGSAATPEQLDQVLEAITNIFTPDTP
jgi:hypothetical protein